MGWCREAEVLLGTRQARYDTVDWTTTKESRTDVTLASQTVSLAASAKGIFGLSLSRNYTISQNRDLRFPFANRKNKLDEALKNHLEEQVILYDPEERRAWLVPFLSILLHTIILRIRKYQYSLGGREDDLYAIPQANGANAALRALQKSRTAPLPDVLGSDNDYFMEDLLKLVLFALQNTYQRPGKSSITGKWIFGHELMDIVRCQPPFSVKRSKIELAHGGWGDLTHDIQLVLFCRGIGEALQPHGHAVEGICVNWLTLPRGANYLAATMQSLVHVAARTGHSQTCEYLMEDYKWHCNSSCFQFDGSHDTRFCNCNPLHKIEKQQKFWPPKFLKSGSKDSLATVPMKTIPLDGAVVFGEAPLRHTHDVVENASEVVVLPQIQFAVGSELPKKKAVNEITHERSDLEWQSTDEGSGSTMSQASEPQRKLFPNGSRDNWNTIRRRQKVPDLRVKTADGNSDSVRQRNRCVVELQSGAAHSHFQRLNMNPGS